MIWWVLSTFLLSFSTIFRKKAMALDAKIGSLWFMFFGIIWWTIIWTFLILTWRLNTEIFTLKYIVLTATIGVLRICSTLISQYVYTREKISLIAPYENLNKILSIILAFFIFWDVSVVSLSIAILVVLIIFFSSYDFKQRHIPKTIQLFSINQVIISINTLIVWYILLNLSAMDFFILDKIIIFIILFSLIILNWDLFRFRKLEKKFVQTRMTASILWSIAYILSLYIISEFGVTINILLSFIYLIFILCLSYFILWDKPTKKSVTVSVVVVVLVWLWFYFK